MIDDASRKFHLLDTWEGVEVAKHNVEPGLRMRYQAHVGEHARWLALGSKVEESLVELQQVEVAESALS